MNELYLYCKAGKDAAHIQLISRYPYWKGYLEDFKTTIDCLDLNKPAIEYALQNNDIQDKTLIKLYMKALKGEKKSELLKDYSEYRKFAKVDTLSASFLQKQREKKNHFMMIQDQIKTFREHELTW